MKVYDTIHEAYLGTITDVLDNPDYVCKPRGMEIYEKVDYSFKVLYPVAEPIVTKDLERNKVIAEYTKKEMDLYDSYSNKAKDFAKASLFWNKIQNPDGTINSAYGYLIWKNKSQGNRKYEVGSGAGGCDMATTQSQADKLNNWKRSPWDWAKQCLISDKDTRQAVMHFALPEHKWIGNKDQVCTMHANWLIRDNQLNLTITMRSNDLALGLPYDISWFISLIDMMRSELAEVYPDLKCGSYTHIAHSMHIYTKDFDRMKKMIGRC